MLVIVAIRKEHPRHDAELVHKLVELSTRVTEDEHFFEYHTAYLLKVVKCLNEYEIDFGIAFPKAAYARME